MLPAVAVLVAALLAPALIKHLPAYAQTSDVAHLRHRRRGA